MARCNSLSEWLAWQEGLHPNPIDLGLERVKVVLQRLAIVPRCPVITIAGTKGKGSCAELLHSMLSAGGYRVGLFTSPHLRRYNERIRIAGMEVSDASLCAAFERIDHARSEISLTYFEFNALAALLCFDTAGLDAWVLEVGMGGRLDAVNIIDADVALVTAIGIDHTEWLGNDLNSIAREKAGIFRAHRPALFGSTEMPPAREQVATEVGALLWRAGRDFSFMTQGKQWSWSMREVLLQNLPLPALPGAVQVNNASTALAALHLLSEPLPLTRAALELGLQRVRLPGRLQSLTTAEPHCEWLLDVAHNPMSAAVLADHLATLPRRRTLALIGIMADKDIEAMVAVLSAQIDAWLAVSVGGTRALSAAALANKLRAAGVSVLAEAAQVAEALATARRLVVTQDFERVLVFGSFLMVGPALDSLHQ